MCVTVTPVVLHPEFCATFCTVNETNATLTASVAAKSTISIADILTYPTYVRHRASTDILQQIQTHFAQCTRLDIVTSVLVIRCRVVCS